MVIFDRRKSNFALALLAVFITALSSCDGYFFNDLDSRFGWRGDVRWNAPSPAVGDSYSFIVVSDLHINFQADADYFAKLKDKLESGDRFLVITGDLTGSGTRGEFLLYLDAAAAIGIPCYPVIGNHDTFTDSGRAWKDILGAVTYRIDSSDTTLLILDNANAAFGYDQLNWLEAELKSAGKNTFVFAHYNFFVEASPPDVYYTLDIRERARLMYLLKNRCTAMFMGHLHERIVKESGGVQYFVLENYGGNGGPGTFCRVRVSPSGTSFEFDKL